MIINGVDYGVRSSRDGVVDNPQRFVSAGVSMAGDVTVLDLGVVTQTIPVTLFGLTNQQKNELKAYLVDTIKPYGTVSVTPDSSDDLQVSASSAVNLKFVSFNANWVAYNLWTVNLVFQYYGNDTIA